MKTIENEEESFWPVLIMMEGKPYRLAKVKRKDVNNPCELCDLRIECGYPDNLDHFMRLCTSDDRDEGWYFEEDWSIVGQLVADFVTDVATFQ